MGMCWNNYLISYSLIGDRRCKDIFWFDYLTLSWSSFFLQGSSRWRVLGSSWFLCLLRYALCIYELPLKFICSLEPGEKTSPKIVYWVSCSPQFPVHLNHNFVLSYAVVLYMHFVTSIVHEITTALGIYCFR